MRFHYVKRPLVLIPKCKNNDSATYPLLKERLSFCSFFLYLYGLSIELGEHMFNLSEFLCRYLEAVRRLKADGKKFLRTIYLTFVPGIVLNVF